MRILICGCGGTTPRNIARALRRDSRHGEHVLVGADINPFAISHYQEGLFDSTYVCERPAEPHYWQFIGAIVDKHHIEMAIVQAEAEVEAWAERREINELPCPVLLPPLALVRACREKSETMRILEPRGLAPMSIRLSDQEGVDLAESLEGLGFPCWVRAVSGTSGLGSWKARTAEEALTWVRLNGERMAFSASEYLPGRNLACKLLYHRGKLLRAASAERITYIMSQVAPSGITGNTSRGRFVNEEGIVNRSRLAMEALAADTGSELHGMFTVDLKENAAGIAMVTEVNVRNVAFVGEFCAKGAHVIDDIIDVTLGSSDILRGEFVHYVLDPDEFFLRDVDAEPVFVKASAIKRRDDA